MDFSQEIFLRKTSGLVRKITPIDALMANCAAMGFASQFINFYFASSFFPGTDLLQGIIIASFLSMFIALCYSLLSIAMPRTGGDYIWVSRFISPPVGFMLSFFLTIIMILWMGSCVVYLVRPTLTTLFIGLGIYFHNPWYAQVASSVGTPMNMFIIGTTINVVGFLPMFYSAKATMNVIKACVYYSIIAGTVWLVAMLIAGHAGFVSRFNELTGTTYDATLAAIKQAGVPSFSLGATMIGTSYIFLGLVGYNMTAYFSGEIKDVRKSQMIGIPLAIILTQAFSWVCTWAIYDAVGGYFWNGLNALYWSGSTAYPLPDWATAYLFIVYASASPIPLILICTGAIVALVACTVLSIPFAATRNIFSWSFDRIVPTKIAEVDRRGVPRYAVAVTLIIGVISTWATVFTHLLDYYAYSITGWYFVMMVVGITAVIFPYRSRGRVVLEQAPAIARAKVGPVYIVALMGAVSAVVSGFIMYTSLTPAIIGLMRWDYLATLIGTVIVGAIIYFVAYAYNKRKGVPIHLAHTEIPPA
jgi:amino acid transporter